MQKTKEAIVQEIDKLPNDKLEEVLDFVAFLQRRSKRSSKVITLRGLWAGKVAPDAERELKKLRKKIQQKLDKLDL